VSEKEKTFPQTAGKTVSKLIVKSEEKNDKELSPVEEYFSRKTMKIYMKCTHRMTSAETAAKK
jgi:hypothetical protein